MKGIGSMTLGRARVSRGIRIRTLTTGGLKRGRRMAKGCIAGVKGKCMTGNGTRG